MKQFFRILSIIGIIRTYQLDEKSKPLVRLLIKILFFFQIVNLKAKDLSYGQRLALGFEELGPVFIKFGQLLSIRPDLVGEELAINLQKLQDQCAYVEFSAIKQIIEKSFNQPLQAIFSSFDQKPIASASIAQVHYATLKNGQKVAVKVVKPDIEKLIRSDIFILKLLSNIFDFFNNFKGIELRNIINQFARLIEREQDMKMEAANASYMARKLELIEWVKIPQIHWQFLSTKVLVMQRFEGTSINNIKKIDQLNLDKELIANRGLELVLRQVFQHNFFHSDLHPGNILIDKQGQLLLVDFGLVGHLNELDKHYLASNYLAFFNHDYVKVAQNHINSGWIPKDTNLLDFQAHLRMVIEPLSQKSLQEISVAKLLMTLFIVARKFNMKVPHELALVDKTLLQIESMGKKLYPDLNVWQVMKPLIEKFVREQQQSFQSLEDLKLKLNEGFKAWLSFYPLIEDYLKKDSIHLIETKKQKQPQKYWLGFLSGIVLTIMISLIAQIQ